MEEFHELHRHTYLSYHWINNIINFWIIAFNFFSRQGIPILIKPHVFVKITSIHRTIWVIF